jgi:hypothetical protein
MCANEHTHSCAVEKLMFKTTQKRVLPDVFPV